MYPKQGISDTELRLKYNEEVQDLKRKIKTVEGMLADYKKAHGSIAVLFDGLKDAIQALPLPKPVNIVKTNKAAVETPCGVCFQICDTHYGAVQNKSEVEGFGEYSPEICEARSMEFIRRGVNWVNVHRTAYKVDTAHVLVTGDLISGDIHLELQVTNAFPAPVQTAGSARLLAQQLSELSRHFKQVIVHFIVEDNHARLTKKPQAKEAGLNSFNYLVGEMAKLMLKGHKNITFNIYPQYEAVVNVEGRRYLIMHGHNMPPGMVGISWYGIERKVMKEALKRMNTDDYRRFHKVIMGHFHTPISTPTFWMGGSVSGTDAYDHKNGRYSLPSQSSWLVHPKWGEFNRVDWLL